MKMHRALCLILPLILAANVSAGVTLVSGTGTLQSVANEKYFPDPYNTDSVNYWPERSGVTLANNLVVSILTPPTFPAFSISHSNDNSLTIPSGTNINSYLLNYDPAGGTTVATFSFGEPILGLITNSRDTALNDHFMLSDFLIDPAVPTANLSPTHYDARGIEPSVNGDFVKWLSASEIEVHLGASTPGDQIRVITSAPAPEPASIGLVGLVFIATRRRGSHRGKR